MQIEIKQGDVLAEPADGLVCSANVFLNLSGGVGGEILRRHGDAMQKALHSYLHEHNQKFVKQGDVVKTDGFGTGFKFVLHAVAVDGWYQSSAEVVIRILGRAFEEASSLSARKLAVVALATGYGRLSFEEFGQGFRQAAERDYPPLQIACVVVPTSEQVEKLTAIVTRRDCRQL